MSFVTKLQFDDEANDILNHPPADDPPKREERSEFQIEDLLDFGNTEEQKAANEKEDEEELIQLDEPEEKIQAKRTKHNSLTNKTEFQYELAKNMVGAINNLVLNFSKIDKVIDYLIKNDFLEKSLIFVSNRIERFPTLINVLYDNDRFKEFFKYLFLNGQRFRGHKIL